jgi:hypothetical protein
MSECFVQAFAPRNRPNLNQEYGQVPIGALNFFPPFLRKQQNLWSKSADTRRSVHRLHPIFMPLQLFRFDPAEEKS